MLTSLARFRSHFVVASLCVISVIACAARTADSSNGSGGGTSDSSTRTGTSTGIGGSSGGATASTGGATASTGVYTSTGTATAFAGCVSHDAGVCENSDDSGVLPVPAASSFVKFQLSATSYGQGLVTTVLVTTTDTQQIASLHALLLTGLATFGGTVCTTSCPAMTHYYALTFYGSDGRTLTVRVQPYRIPCGGISLEATNCVVPGDPTAILQQVETLLDLDAGLY
jgi:hypothetical protein